MSTFLFQSAEELVHNFSVITHSCIYNLLNRKIKHFIFVSHHPDAQFRNWLLFLLLEVADFLGVFFFISFSAISMFIIRSNEFLTNGYEWKFLFIRCNSQFIRYFVLSYDFVTTPAPTVLPPSRIANLC